MSSIQLNNLLNRLTNLFNKNPQSNLYQILGGVGAALDTVDPGQRGLADQFSVTSASGTALDQHGADWGVSRRYNETDASYRQRILSVLPTYASGPTVANIMAVAKPFTGIEPDIYEYGPSGFTMGVSTMGQFGFSHANDAFTFKVNVNNPNNVVYNQQDLINAVNRAKPARSTAVFAFN